MAIPRLRRLVLPLPLLGLVLAAPLAAEEPLDRLSADIGQAGRQLEGLRADMVQLAQSSGYGAVDASGVERRFSAIEAEMQRLTGEIERLGYVQRQLADRMDRFQSDVEYRLKALEGRAPSTTGAVQGSGGAGAPQVLGSVSAGELAAVQGQSQGQQTAGFGSGGLNLSTQPQGGTAQASAAGLPQGSAKQQYDYAFGLLRQADYQGAEQALRSFIQQHPNDPLVANAKYWLGETYYVRGDYQQAVQAFAQSYQDHPDGPKAADSLLKLGLSLSLEGQTQQACQILQELDSRMGNTAKANILDRAHRERMNLGC